MSQELDDLKNEADSLGITYSTNIGVAKLQEKVDAYYKQESEVNSQPVVKDEPQKEEKVSGKPKTIEQIREEAVMKGRMIIAQSVKESRELDVVKIVMVDKREASTATSAYFNNGIDAMRVPLDVFVEMPKGLIAMAESAKATIHVESNGVTTPKDVKKYVVEYKNK